LFNVSSEVKRFDKKKILWENDFEGRQDESMWNRNDFKMVNTFEAHTLDPRWVVYNFFVGF